MRNDLMFRRVASPGQYGSGFVHVLQCPVLESHACRFRARFRIRLHLCSRRGLKLHVHVATSFWLCSLGTGSPRERGRWCMQFAPGLHFLTGLRKNSVENASIYIHVKLSMSFLVANGVSGLPL